MERETLTSIKVASKKSSVIPKQISLAVSELERIMVHTDNKEYWTVLELWNSLYKYNQTKAWHSLLVSFYAQKLNFFYRGKIKNDEIFIAGLVHDIGQLKTPSEILCKVGSLSTQEYKKVMEHVLTGIAILKQFNIKNRTINDALLGHHESWNGKGYPFSKKGKDISYSGRLFKIADQFEALQGIKHYSLRKYIKEPFTLQESIFYIKDQMGTTFDPKFETPLIKLGNWYGKNFLS